MNDAEFRRRAHAVLAACALMVDEAMPRAEIKALIAAGPSDFRGTVQAPCGCAWLRDSSGSLVERLMSCPDPRCQNRTI